MNWPQIVSQYSQKKIDFVLLTLVEVIGSAPQTVGAKALITFQGLAEGTVGGGKLEAKAIALAQELLAKNENRKNCQLIKWNLTKDVGMTCGGVVSLVFEVFAGAEWQIAVFGAGHVAQELVPLVTKLDCRAHCVDSRRDWLDKIPDSINLQKICIENPKELVSQFSNKTKFILVTKGHATDVPILIEILRQHPKAFVGVIGSRSKAVVLRKELRDLGFADEQLNFHCPVGLPFGNNTPIEISISILAQLIQNRDFEYQKQNQPTAPQLGL
jgi:xanthine dehydrogenase accessory factor